MCMFNKISITHPHVTPDHYHPNISELLSGNPMSQTLTEAKSIFISHIAAIQIIRSVNVRAEITIATAHDAARLGAHTDLEGNLVGNGRGSEVSGFQRQRQHKKSRCGDHPFEWIEWLRTRHR